MNMIATTPGILGVVAHLLVFAWAAGQLPLGALSLPCMLALTSLVYFYVMPVTATLFDTNNVVGMKLTSMEEAHWINLLYLLGAVVAFALSRSALLEAPE